MSPSWLLALFGVLLVSSSFHIVHAEDAAEGEGKEESESTTTEDSDVPTIVSSPDASVVFMILQPEDAMRTSELVAGRITKFLIGFANRGEKDFSVHFSHTSFRFPGDFSYTVQNFTAARIERTVAPKREATFDFALIPSEAFTGRPLGLVVDLYYSDADGNHFRTTAFNQTVNIVEDESIFNAEYYFLALTGIGFVVLLLLLGQNVLSRFTRKQPQRARVYQELGTKSGDLDYEWIPKSHLEKKSPKSPKSPRQRRPQKAN